MSALPVTKSVNKMFASESYNPWAIAWRCLRDSVFSGFDTIPVCDRRTDRRTDGRQHIPKQLCHTLTSSPLLCLPRPSSISIAESNNVAHITHGRAYPRAVWTAVSCERRRRETCKPVEHDDLQLCMYCTLAPTENHSTWLCLRTARNGPIALCCTQGLLVEAQYKWPSYCHSTQTNPIWTTVQFRARVFQRECPTAHELTDH